MKRTPPEVTVRDSDPNPDEALRRVQPGPSEAVQRAIRSDRREVRNTINRVMGR